MAVVISDYEQEGIAMADIIINGEKLIVGDHAVAEDCTKIKIVCVASQEHKIKVELIEAKIETWRDRKPLF